MGAEVGAETQQQQTAQPALHGHGPESCGAASAAGPRNPEQPPPPAVLPTAAGRPSAGTAALVAPCPAGGTRPRCRSAWCYRGFPHRGVQGRVKHPLPGSAGTRCLHSGCAVPAAPAGPGRGARRHALEGGQKELPPAPRCAEQPPGPGPAAAIQAPALAADVPGKPLPAGALPPLRRPQHSGSCSSPAPAASTTNRSAGTSLPTPGREGEGDMGAQPLRPAVWGAEHVPRLRLVSPGAAAVTGDPAESPAQSTAHPWIRAGVLQASPAPSPRFSHWIPIARSLELPYGSGTAPTR